MKPTVPSPVHDPVCGMDIDPARAVATSTHDSTTYYFCALTCQERFDATPATYLQRLVPASPLPSRLLYSALQSLHANFANRRSQPNDQPSLPPLEWEIMSTLGEQGACKMREVATACETAMSTLTGLIDRLIAKGLVQRHHSTTDRRVVLVSHSDKGQMRYQEHLEADMQQVLTMLEALEPDEQHTFVHLMHKSVNALTQMRNTECGMQNEDS